MVIQILLSRDANMRIENVVILRYHLMPMLSYRRTIFDCLLTWREKLAAKTINPYRVVAAIGLVAFCLELLPVLQT